MTGPSHEPLDDQERELARILRALPGAEPSAAIDQRILRAAADAAASARAPRRRARAWLAFGGAGWGIGGAAAAVLALGVGWHLLDPARNLPMERSAPVAAPAQEDAIAVDLGELRAPASEPAPSTAPPAAARPAPAAAQAPRPSRRGEAAGAPAFAPPPPPPPPAPVVEPESGINAIDVASVESTTILTAEQIAKSSEEERAREQRVADAQAAHANEAAKAAQAGALARQAQAADAPAGNGAMTPARWLAQVRDLRDAHRRTEAAESLRRFHQYYPQYAIPADLLPLMRE